MKYVKNRTEELYVRDSIGATCTFYTCLGVLFKIQFNKVSTVYELYSITTTITE